MGVLVSVSTTWERTEDREEDLEDDDDDDDDDDDVLLPTRLAASPEPAPLLSFSSALITNSLFWQISRANSATAALPGPARARSSKICGRSVGTTKLLALRAC